jgi:5'-nucleotidase
VEYNYFMSQSKPFSEVRAGDEKLVIGISSRALFDLRHSHEIFESMGLEAYLEYQVAREDVFLKPGVAFPLVRKLLALNEDG